MNALTFAEMREMATLFAASKMFPDAASAAQAFVKIQAGRELGFEPYAAMQAIDVIKGKLQLNANAQAVLVKRSGRYDYQVLQHDEQACIIEFFEAEPGSVIGRKRSLGKSAFSIADAQRAGIMTEMYKKYPRNMLFSRAMTNGVAWYCPDAIGMRVYGEGEIAPETAGPAPASAITAEVSSSSISPSGEPVPASLPAPKMLSEKLAEKVTVGSGPEARILSAEEWQQERAKAGKDIQDAIAHREARTHEAGLPVHPDENLLIEAILEQIAKLHPKGSDPVARKAAICDTLHDCLGLDVRPDDLGDLGAILERMEETQLEDGMTALKGRMKP